MMKKSLLLVACGLTASAACNKQSPESTTPGDQTGSAPEGSEQMIPFEKYTLANGLTVILHQDRSDPMVAMATVVHVGSSREEPGRTGFAHLFEHMSFNDSENVPKGANRKMIPEWGGTRNGGTWTDGTIYYEVVPKDAFEKLMWIDSDRLGYMINTVTKGTFEREKQVVKNEKRQRVDNRPYGHTGHVIRKALYPAGHPYSWTVIGELDDLQSATLDDVREFYFRYYMPANATLVVAGDIDIERTKKLVERWFGEIAAGKQPPADLPPMPVTLDKEKKLYHLDNFAQVAELRLTFPTVEQFHPDSYALEALAAILADGKTAPFYETIVVDKKQSSEVSAYQSSNELAGTFTINVRANPNVDLDDVYASIDEALTRFEKEGFRTTDLERYKATSEAAFYFGIESILDKALQLGIYNEFAGDPGFLIEERKRVAALTREDVLRVYDKYIKNKPAVITSFVPKNQPKLIVTGSTEAQVVEEKIVAGAEKKFVETGEEGFEKTPTKYDRSEPPLGARPVVKAPAIWQAQTPRGIDILGIEQREIPMVSFHLRIDGGQWLDPAGLTGTARLTADLLNEGTRSKTPQQLQDAIDLLGASIEVSASRTSIDVTGYTLAKNFDATMALMSEMLLEPRWDAAEFSRLKTALLADIEQRAGNPPWIGRNALLRQIYGPEHVAGEPFGGTAETVAKIELAMLKDWYAQSVSSAHATLHVAGAVDRDQAVAAMARLDEQWTGQKIAFPPLKKPAPPAKPRVFFIDVPGSKQSVIYVGKAALEGSDPRFYQFTVANNRLGAGSSARLFQTLRIEKGYSYGAYSWFSRVPYMGVFVARSQVRSNVTLESLEIFKNLITGYADTFTAADLKTTVNLISKADTRRFETLGDLRDVLELMSRFDLPADYIERQREQLTSLSLEDVRGLIQEQIRGDQMTYVVVGDARTQLARIEKLGLGKPVLLDREGVPIAGK